MGGLDDFNSDDFDVEVPEFDFHRGAPSLRALKRIVPEHGLIGRAGLCAHWGMHDAAERIRDQAGYSGVSDDEA